MKYLRQFAIILSVTCIGETLKYLLPFPVPASIYGLVLMFVLLVTKVIRLEDVDSAASFLIEIMPVMFIPAGVGLMTTWENLAPVLLPVSIIMILSTFIVMAVTGKVTDRLASDESTKSSSDDERAGNLFHTLPHAVQNSKSKHKSSIWKEEKR